MHSWLIVLFYISELHIFFCSLILGWCAWRMHKTVLCLWEPFLGCCMLMIQRQGKNLNSWLCITFIIMQTFYNSYYDITVVLLFYREKLWELLLHDAVLSLCCYEDDDSMLVRTFAGLADGTLAVTEVTWSV